MNDDWLTVCDGYRAIQTKEPIELEMIPSHLDALKVDRMIDDHYNKTVKLPTISEVKQYIKMMKAGSAEKYIILDTEYDEQIALNPAYLLDLLEAIPSEYGQYNSNIGPIYLENDTTRGIVLSVRINR